MTPAQRDRITNIAHQRNGKIHHTIQNVRNNITGKSHFVIVGSSADGENEEKKNIMIRAPINCASNDTRYLHGESDQAKRARMMIGRI
jgi:hypothetical protein